MIGDHGFVHCDDRIQHGLRSVVHGGDELGTDPDPLLFLILAQQLGHPSGRLLFEAEILVQDVENCFFLISHGRRQSFPSRGDDLP